MSSLRHNRHERGRRRAGQSGLVLGELFLVLLVLGLVVTLVLTALGRLRQGARLEHLGSDLQTFAAVLERAREDGGQWPATAPDAGWGVPPVGGEYGWVPPAGADRPGLVTVTAFSPHFPLKVSRRELLALDRRIDDGDLATGRFRTGFNGWPVYLVGDKP